MAVERESLLAQGAEFVKSELLAQIDDALQVRSSVEIRESDLIADSLLVNKSVHREVKARVRERQENVRKLIAATAYYVEAEGRNAAAPSGDLTPLQRGRLDKFRAAEREVRLSFGTLASVVEIYKRIHLSIRDEIERLPPNGDRRARANAYLKNALLVYELSDFVLRQLQSFEMSGIDDIRAIRDEIFAEIKQGRKADEELAKKTRQVSQEQAAAVLREIDDRSKFRAGIIRKWDEIMKRLDSTGDFQDEVEKILPGLEVTRDNARNRMQLLTLATTTMLVDEAVRSISGLASSLPEWELPRIDERLVCELLNLDLHDG